MMRRSGPGGFVLVELMIVLAVLAPILYAVLSTTSVVSDSVSVNQRNADSQEATRFSSLQVTRLLRAASLSSLRVPDGENWIEPVDGNLYRRLQFQIVEGLPSSNSTNLGPPCLMEFVLEDKEIRNDRDDDHDGLVDEGRIFYTDTTRGRTCLVQGIERFELRKNGRILSILLQSGKRDRNRTVHRTKQLETIYLRNN